MTTPWVRRYFVLASCSCCSSQSGPFDTSATVVMPRASSTGLAPSITDSPIAKYGLSCSTVVGGAVERRAAAPSGPARRWVRRDRRRGPAWSTRRRIVVGRSAWSVVVGSIARPASLSHSIWPTHWLLGHGDADAGESGQRGLAIPTRGQPLAPLVGSGGSRATVAAQPLAQPALADRRLDVAVAHLGDGT